MKLGIIGNGFVGKATGILGKNGDDIKIICYDVKSELCKPSGTTMNDIFNCNMVFICVPTPMGFDGKCQIDIVSSIVKNLRDNEYKGYIIIRSTVPPGTCKQLGCFHIPEFLTEKSYESDFINAQERIIGTNDHLHNNNNFKKEIQMLFTLSKENGAISNDHIEFVSVEESEIIKYTRNAFLATKIGFFNEIYSYCKRIGVSYENVRKCVCLDNRIGNSHSMVPGPDGKYGFGGTCLMKDIVAFSMSMESANVAPLILRPVIGRNARKDRPNEQWHKPKTETYTKEYLKSSDIAHLKDIVNNNLISYSEPIEKNELIFKILKSQQQSQQQSKQQEQTSRYAHHPSNFPKTNNNTINNIPSIGFNSGIQNPF